ncbi:DUF4352 domain-containing protein [Alkalihalobacillus sp. FSL R5-0424]
MKINVKSFFFTLLLVIFLFGCSSSEEGNSTDSKETQALENDEQIADDEGEEDESNTDSSSEGSGLIDKDELNKGEDSNEDNSNKDQPNLGDGETEDQVDLSIGDTAIVETTISKYEVTLDAVEFMDELEGEAVQSQFDTLVLADVTIKNLSDESIDISDSMGIFEITTSIEGSGYSDVAAHFSGVDKFSGELNPNEKASGQMLFEEINGEHHYLRVTPGLTASNAVKNEATWVFTEDEG